MTRAIPLLPPGLSVGEYAPWFTAPTPSNPKFRLSTVAGRYVLLGFLPPDEAGRRQALEALDVERARFDDQRLTAFIVVRDTASIGLVRDQPPGVRCLLDPDGAISRLFGARDHADVEQPIWVLLDPTLRVLAIAPIEDAPAMMRRVAALPPIAEHAGAPLSAPVLIVPRVFEPALCRELIAIRAAQSDDVCRDAAVEDPKLRNAVRVRLQKRLAPEIDKAFQFRPTRAEHYVTRCYDAAQGGELKPRRDNDAPGAEHRKFAISINLNAEEFDGGDLRFPEFGPRVYRPPTGGAVVFSCSLLHEVTPVTQGRRYAFLPFLYDDDSARLRTEGD